MYNTPCFTLFLLGTTENGSRMVWSLGNQEKYISIENGTRIEFIGSKEHHACIQTLDPIPLTSRHFYFETKVLQSGSSGTMAICLLYTSDAADE